MFIKYPLIVLTVMLAVQPVFADEDMNMMMGSDEKPCMMIAKACSDAGYTHQGAEGKQFWKDCMKPLLMGKMVSGVTVKADEVKSCRKAKINQLKQDLNQLRGAK